mgnify:CR=1 FL=1
MNGEYLWVENRKFNPNRDYLWAIPLTDIDLSKGSLKAKPRMVIFRGLRIII